jgi:hypothetical protein
MITLLDIAERTQKGLKLEDKAWNLGLFRKMSQLAAKYELLVPAEVSFFNYDTELPDRVFQAAVEFLSEIGVLPRRSPGGS